MSSDPTGLSSVTERLTRIEQRLSFVIHIYVPVALLIFIGSSFFLCRWFGKAALSRTPIIALEGQPTSYPTHWKSVESGATKILRFEGEYLYVETKLSDDGDRLGEFGLAELKKEGKKFVGRQKFRIVRSYIDPVTKRKESRDSCDFEMKLEVNYLSQARIEGRIFGPPIDGKIDWKRCVSLEPYSWHTFVWIPQ